MVNKMNDFTDYWLLAITIGAGVGGWYIRTVRDEIKALEICVSRLSQQMAGADVRTDGARDRLERIETKIDRLFDQVANKVDRDDCLHYHRNVIGDRGD